MKIFPAAHWRPVLALVVLSAIWGYNWIMMKAAVKYAAPFDFAAIRTVLGALSLFIVIALYKRIRWPDHIGQTALLGILQTSGFFGFSMWALEAGGAGKTAALVYTMPFWVLVFAWPLLKERVRGIQWPAIVLAFVGLMFVLAPWQAQSNLSSKLLAVMAGVSWGLSVVVAKALRRKSSLDLLSLTAWQMLFGALPFLVIFALTPSHPIQWEREFIWALFYNVIPANAVAWVLWLYILGRLPAGPASLGLLGAPVIGVLAAWIQLDEQPGVAELWGMVCIALGLLLLSVQGWIRLKFNSRLAVNPE
ncbi:MAG: permease [Betaproteobacteria bacterium RBG_16_58_11]|nr:MAG: permease [Betaproteobacteria bacterium RBG_16_58_11]OFZ97926.1 MAG: permease [Betaproteobacteria bacterium RBG_19FT_COMBO_58_11]